MPISSKIKRWYLGGPLPIKEVVDESTTIHRAPDTFEPSTSARFAQWCVKNILGVIVAIAAVIGAALGILNYNGNQPTEDYSKEKSAPPIINKELNHDQTPTN